MRGYVNSAFPGAERLQVFDHRGLRGITRLQIKRPQRHRLPAIRKTNASCGERRSESTAALSAKRKTETSQTKGERQRKFAARIPAEKASSRKKDGLLPATVRCGWQEVARSFLRR